MSEQLELKFEPRSGLPDIIADTTPYSLAWRFFKSHYSQLNLEKKQAASAAQARRKSLAELARQVYALSRQDNLPVQLSEACQGFLSLLEQLDTHILSPVGSAYDDDLMQFLDNTAVFPSEQYSYPIVKEVIVPAIFCEGECVQRGKAVIGVPLPRLDQLPGDFK